MPRPAQGEMIPRNVSGERRNAREGAGRARRGPGPRARTLAAVTAALLLLPLLSGCSRGRSLTDEVRLVISDDILSLDPNRDVDSVTDSVLSNVYQPLVTLDEGLLVETALAERWEHPSPERWRFHLREDVLFHDGTPLTARIARDSLLALQKDPALESSAFLRHVVRVEAVSDTVLDLVTREPRALLPSLLSVYVVKKNARGAFPPYAGTGPFRIEEWKKNERVVLARFEDYWGGPAEVARAVFTPLGDPAGRLARLERGEADIVYGVPAEMAARPLAKGTRLVRSPGLTVYYLGLNVRDVPGNPFHDRRVRRAVHLALDRQGMVRKTLHGAAVVATQPVSPLVFGYSPRIPPPVRDVARARALLAEAGHARGFTVRLDFTSTRAATALSVKEALAEVGVTVELNPLEGNGVFDLAEAGKSDFYFAGWDCTSGEASEFYEFNLHTRTAVAGLGNVGGYSNARLDELAERNAAVLDPRKRKELLEEAATIVMDDLPLLPLFVEENLFGVREGITFTPPADGEIRLAALGARR